MTSLALSWSGGKDSALALWTIRAELRVEPGVLLTTVTEDYDRISIHGVRRGLLRRQAAAAGIPLAEISIPADCTDELYEARMAAALIEGAASAVEEIAFGDLFLAGVRARRERLLARAGKRGRFPIWGRDTSKLARSFVDAGFEAVIVCVDPGALDSSFAGRRYDRALLNDLPPSVDPCGENGEFHTFVFAGPIFREPIDCAVGTVVEREGLIFCDVVHVSASCTSA